MSGPELHDQARGRRMWIMSGVLTLLFLIAITRLLDLQVVRGGANRLASDHNRFRKEVLRAQRGRILDREGRLLVDNFASFVVTINPHEPALRSKDRLGETIAFLAVALERDSTALADAVSRGRRTSFLPVRVEQNLSQAEVAKIEEAGLPGVGIRVEPLRRYPHGVLAAHVLGHVGEISAKEYNQRRDLGYEADDQVGKAAIEERYDRVLHQVVEFAVVEPRRHGQIACTAVTAVAACAAVWPALLFVDRNGHDTRLVDASIFHSVAVMCVEVDVEDAL